MFAEILTWVLAFVMPWTVMQACKRSRVLDSIGAVIILYAFGLVAGLAGLKSDSQTIISNITVPLAIPLILFGNTISFSGRQTRDTALAFGSCLVSAILAVGIGYAIFRPGPTVGGMVSGCVTGGTMNMASLKLALGADDATFVMLNTFDMSVSFLYLLFLLAFGIRIARKVLPNRTNLESEHVSSSETLQRPSALQYSVHLLTAILCCAIAYGVSQLFDESIFMMVFIMVVTSLGIILSYNRRIRTTPGSYDLGMYLVYAFSFVVASMADFKGMSISQNVSMFGFFAVAVFGSMLLHFVFSWILGIDADTAVIASNAFVNAPPSVPVIASAMKNRTALTAGLSIGIIGYAIGTYLGIFMSKVLQWLF